MALKCAHSCTLTFSWFFRWSPWLLLCLYLFWGRMLLCIYLAILPRPAPLKILVFLDWCFDSLSPVASALSRWKVGKELKERRARTPVEGISSVTASKTQARCEPFFTLKRQSRGCQQGLSLSLLFLFSYFFQFDFNGFLFKHNGIRFNRILPRVAGKNFL